MNKDLIYQNLEQRNPNEPEFMQAVREVIDSVEDVYNQHPEFDAQNIIERITEPDRVLSFMVPWVDDQGNVQVNRGFRVQFNNALGIYKGGLRFHPSVNLSTLKFLGFEQTFKNALTGLPLGGAKGGSDFNPKGKSDNEIMRFCQSFMLEVWRILGAEIDVPAGDIGVGAREIGFLYGMYKKLRLETTGVITGKGTLWGGSLIRPEATGFGGVYFIQEMLKQQGDQLKDKKITVSGFGNVAWGAVLKATELGAKVVTISGPDGYVYDPEGISGEKIEYMLELRASNNDVVKPYAEEYGVEFFEGKKPWEVPCDIAITAAIQNELDGEDAKQLISNKVGLVCELSNMGCTPEAIEEFHHAAIPFSPGKASNAGGVAVSGLEMAQNAMKLHWSREEVDQRLHGIMKNIHQQCVQYGDQGGYINYVDGANKAGFLRVAYAMLDLGVI